MNENGPNEGAVNEGTGRENGNQRRSRGSNQGRTPPAGSGVKSAWGASPQPAAAPPATPPPSLAAAASPGSRGRVITGDPRPSSVAQSLRPGRSSEIGIGRVPYGNSTQGQRRTPGRNILPGAVSAAPVTPQNNGRHPRGRNNRRVPSTGENGTLLPSQVKPKKGNIYKSLIQRGVPSKNMNTHGTRRPGAGAVVPLPRVPSALASPPANAGAGAGAGAVAPLPPISSALASPANAGAGAGAVSSRSVGFIESKLKDPAFVTYIARFLLDESKDVNNPLFEDNELSFKDFIKNSSNHFSSMSQENKIAQQPFHPIILMKKVFNEFILPLYHNDFLTGVRAENNPFKNMPVALRFLSTTNSNLPIMNVNLDNEPLSENFFEKLLYLYTLFDKSSINTEGSTFTKKIKMLFINIFAYHVSIYNLRYSANKERYISRKNNRTIIEKNPLITLFYIHHSKIYEFIREFLNVEKASGLNKDKIKIHSTKVLMEKPGSGTQYQSQFDLIYNFIKNVRDSVAVVDELKEHQTGSYGVLPSNRTLEPIPPAVEPANLGKNRNYYGEIVGLLESAMNETNILKIGKIFDNTNVYNQTPSIQDIIEQAGNTINYNPLLEVIYNHITRSFEILSRNTKLIIQLTLLFRHIELYNKLLYCDPYSRDNCKLYDSIEAFKSRVPDNWISKINDFIYHRLEEFYENFKGKMNTRRSQGKVDPELQQRIRNILEIMDSINRVRVEIYEFFKNLKNPNGTQIPLYGYINSHIPNYSDREQEEFVRYLNQLSALFAQLQAAEAALPGNPPQRNAIVNITREIQDILGKIRENQGKIPRALRKTFGNRNSLFRKFYKKYRLGEIDFGNGATGTGAAPVRRIRREISPPRVGTGAGAGSAELPPLRTFRR